MYTNQLRASQTDYNSITNPKIFQFVAIPGIRGLRAIVVVRFQQVIYMYMYMDIYDVAVITLSIRTKSSEQTVLTQIRCCRMWHLN